MKKIVLLSSIVVFAASLSMAQVAISHDVSTHQNKRPYQEDRFVNVSIDKDGGQFFGVYDGHGGDKTSSYLQGNLHKLFRDCLIGKKTKKQAFECAFAKAERYALEIFNDGSTAVVAYIDKDNQLHCAWVGDSRAVLEKNGEVGFATQDHKPERKDEKLRIEDAGGKIRFQGVWRVNGLAVSRSIGDRNLKKMGKGQIIAVPEYAKVALNEDNHFMIIASDGLWDVIDNEEAVRMVKEEFKKTDGQLKDIAQSLQNEAIKRGSGDNITVCIIKFDWLEDKIASKKPLSRMERFWNWLRGKRASDK